MNRKYFPLLAITVLVSGVLACGPTTTGSSPSEPTAAIAPITLDGDLTAIDLCQAIPKEDMEALMGKKLVKNPEKFDLYGEANTSGCMYDGGKSSDGEAFFSYVVLTPVTAYDNQPLYLNVDVPGLGQGAYYNNGADARQLWVKVDDSVAFVVANGDVENEAGQKAIAQLMLAAIQ
jgi:hypothetical protein